jgi:hypothetical protein
VEVLLGPVEDEGRSGGVRDRRRRQRRRAAPQQGQPSPATGDAGPAPRREPPADREQDVELHLDGQRPRRTDRVEDPLPVEHLGEGQVLDQVPPVARQHRVAPGPDDADGDQVERHDAHGTSREEGPCRRRRTPLEHRADVGQRQQEGRQHEEPADHAVQTEEERVLRPSLVGVDPGLARAVVLVGVEDDHQECCEPALPFELVETGGRGARDRGSARGAGHVGREGGHAALVSATGRWHAGGDEHHRR